MIAFLKHHWPEYLMEAAGLGIFMISACLFGALLEYPGSPIHQALPDPFLRRVLTGLAMGTTSICIVYSPWGKQSGAHLNPSMTLTFLRLGKVAPWDALFYIVAQFVGGIAGVMLESWALGNALAHPSVHYVVTAPGAYGVGVAFVSELAITFILMSVILRVSNTEGISRFTGLFAGALVAAYISLEAPLSGMSMNPARTFGSALPAQSWTALWVYFTAPPLGMLLAAEVYQYLKGKESVFCAKLHHDNDRRCIHCAYQERRKAETDRPLLQDAVRRSQQVQ